MTRNHGESDYKIEIWLYANENKSLCGHSLMSGPDYNLKPWPMKTKQKIEDKMRAEKHAF